MSEFKFQINFQKFPLSEFQFQMKINFSHNRSTKKEENWIEVWYYKDSHIIIRPSLRIRDYINKSNFKYPISFF